MTAVTLTSPRARPLVSWRVRKLLVGYSYLVPAALCMLATVVVPIVLAIKMSLYNDVLYKPQDYQFIGLGNYVRLVQDPVFWLTLWNSVVWVFGSVVLQFVAGFAAALLLHQAFRGRALVRTLTLLPWIIPGVVVGLIWEWLYQPNYGVINDLLLRAGLMQERVAWLSSPDLAMGAVVFTNVWRGIPFFAIMLLAGLQAMPKEVLEAAKVDGASAWQSFWHVMFPLMLPVSVTVLIIRIIFKLKLADIVINVTAGGPGGATDTVSSFIYRVYRDRSNVGYGTGLAIFYLLMIILFLTLLLRLSSRWTQKVA